MVSRAQLSWQSSLAHGVRRKPLFHSGWAESGVVTSLVEYAAGSTFPEHGHPQGEEIFVISGELADACEVYPGHSWLWLPPGSVHSPKMAGGALLYVREGGFGAERRTEGAGS